MLWFEKNVLKTQEYELYEERKHELVTFTELMVICKLKSIFSLIINSKSKQKCKTKVMRKVMAVDFQISLNLFSKHSFPNKILSVVHFVPNQSSTRTLYKLPLIER